jgi:TRAP-type uncharacterized transport system substrate-binding protein
MRITKVLKLAVAAVAGLTIAGAAFAQAKPNPKWPTNLTLGTASVGGTYFV